MHDCLISGGTSDVGMQHQGVFQESGCLLVVHIPCRWVAILSAPAISFCSCAHSNQGRKEVGSGHL